MLQVDHLPEATQEPVDSFWGKVLNLTRTDGKPTYPNLEVIVKASLAHGNADIERGFSTSGRVLTEDKAQMSECTLNGIICIDTLKGYN